MTTRPFPSLALLLGVLACLGCGEQEIRAIERLPVPASSDRGRVQVRDGELFTDKGTRLRGATLGLDAAPDTVLEQALFDELSHESGLNAFHVYLENNDDVTGVNVDQADRLVELTSHAGMYLLLGIGGGHLRDDFDLEKVRSFWEFYAPRYAARSHVMYEVQNQPELGCDGPLRAATVEMEREAYARIRELAPDSHVALFSYHATPTAAALSSALDAMAGVVLGRPRQRSVHGRPQQALRRWSRHLRSWLGRFRSTRRLCLGRALVRSIFT